MVALKKKTRATKCSEHHTINLIAHTAKIIANIFLHRRRIERKIKDIIGDDQFGFRRGKGIRDAIGMMRTIALRTLVIDEEMCFFHRCTRSGASIEIPMVRRHHPGCASAI